MDLTQLNLHGGGTGFHDFDLHGNTILMPHDSDLGVNLHGNLMQHDSYTSGSLGGGLTIQPNPNTCLSIYGEHDFTSGGNTIGIQGGFNF